MFEPALPQEPARAGKKLFAADQVQVSSRIPPLPQGIRTFPKFEAYYQTEDRPLTPREQHALMREDARGRMRDPPTLDFLNPKKAWMPSGSLTRPIPPAPPSPRRLLDNPSSTPEKTAANKASANEPSARLMSRPERPVLSEKLELPVKKIDVKKLTERFDQEIKVRRTRHEEAVRRAKEAEVSVGKPKVHNADEDSEPPVAKDVEEFVRRFVTEPLQKKDKNLVSLTSRLCTPNTPKRKLTAAEQGASVRRLFTQSLDHLKSTMIAATKKYIDDQSPKAIRMTREEVEVTSTRLNRNE